VYFYTFFIDLYQSSKCCRIAGFLFKSKKVYTLNWGCVVKVLSGWLGLSPKL